MNGNGKNLDRKFPDILEYWNFYLTDELMTTTRQRYTWLDNFAFIGGNVEFVLLSLGFFFYLYNYNI